MIASPPDMTRGSSNLSYGRRLALVPRYASALIALGLALCLNAQTTPPPSSSSTMQNDDLLIMDTAVVTGYRRSLDLSLETKRNASAIVDVISAEDVSKFPDTNVAESLSHIPGVTVDRLFGQGERVSILGTDPNLNRTLLNGQAVASGDWFILDAPSRQFNYTLLAPEVIGRAEVYKTTEARLPEGSIGGTILLHTRSPLDSKTLTFAGSASDMYNDRDEQHDFSLSQVLGWRNESKTFGVLVGLQWSRENIRRDGVESLGTITAGAANPSVAGVGPAAPPGSVNVTDPGALLPNAINAALFQQLRERKGGNVVVEWRPTSELRFEINTLNVQVENDNFNTSYYVFPGWWRGAVVTNGSIRENIVDAASVSQNIGVMDLFYRKATVKTAVYDGKVTYTSTDFSVSGQAGYTKATGGTQAQYYIEPLLDAPGFGVGSTSYTFNGGATHPGFTFDRAGVNTDPNAWTVGGPWWNGNVAANPQKDSERYAQLDGTYNLRTAFFTKLHGGVRFTDHSTNQNWYIISLTTLPFTTLSSFGPSLTPENFLDGLPGITNDMKRHVMVDRGRLRDAVHNAQYGTTNLTMQQALANGEGFQAPQSFKVREYTDAAYAQTDFSLEKLSGNIGARFVKTDTTSWGWLGTIDNPISRKKSYTNLLPSLNLSYHVANDVTLRFGAAQVIARPNYADLSNSVTLYDSIRTGVGGNPDLDPYESDNLDFAAEWYFAKHSAFAVNLFYKDIDNYILKTNGTENHRNDALGGITPYLISRPQNAGAAKSQGFALFVQHVFDRGFGVTANYTYVDAETNAGGELPFASKHQINLSPYFEHDKFLARLTYAWRDDYFTNVDRGNNVYTRAYTQLDANFAYNITKSLSLTLACTNLLDETYYVYAKVPADMFQAHYKNGRRAQAGVHWNF